MPSLQIVLPEPGEDPWYEKLVKAILDVVAAHNGVLSTATPRPLGPVGVAGTTAGLGAPADHVHSYDGLATAADLQNAVIGAGGTPPTRTITAGTGLTGGGDLTANRTLGVVFGTTAGTVAEGDDDRINGAVQADTIAGADSAWPLLVKVTGDLVSRLGFRADGTIAIGDAPLTISGVTGTSTVTVTTSVDHSYGDGDRVTIDGVSGITGVNGTWTITRTSDTAFTLNGATGSGTYTTGGQAQRVLGGTGSSQEGVANFLAPDTTRDVVVIRGRDGSTKQLLSVRDYQGAIIFSVGPTGGAGVYSSDPHDLLFTTNTTFGRTFAANSHGGVRIASGDPAGGVDILAIGNAITPPTASPDGSHLGEGAFTTTEGVAVWAAGGRPVLRTSSGHEDDPIYHRRRITYGIHAHGNSTAMLTVATPAPTTAGTLTSPSDATGTIIQYETAASTDADAGLISVMGLSQARHAPHLYAKVRTSSAAVTSTRLAVGLISAEIATSAGPATTGSYTTAQGAWLRYDTAVDSTAFWRAVTSSGTNATVTTTTAAIATDTAYELRVEVNAAGTAVRFWVNEALVATHTTDLPGASTQLGYTARIRTLTAASRQLKVSRVLVNQT
ncbi:ubiquitin-activating E1 FCCH domain-containing protein [Glutamicibacter sp. V16R2B1]|uniref:ubiquitin-activating E1 FCCH domain-containing protein n=1 Tax=Glutamicibacter sp. V16R2B1 TaxID=2036207 RepID=UPI0010FDC39F|nr:ubiquitin-activating E1 FCCH domain-containing protein [Glutamicibacter sp. V16R2B1]TLK47470.1 hypothetical protein FDN03_15800 [Glutamicibacter sp. V16R2B1]